MYLGPIKSYTIFAICSYFKLQKNQHKLILKNKQCICAQVSSMSGFIHTPELLIPQKFCPIMKHWLLQNGWCTSAGLINQSGTERGCSEDNLDLHQNNLRSKPISMMQLPLQSNIISTSLDHVEEHLMKESVTGSCPHKWTAGASSARPI